jgi:hypothetical protein
MTKVFQKYLSNIFISIVQEGSQWVICSRVVRNGSLKDKFSKNFDLNEDDTIPLKMQEYLEALQEEHNFAYLALFLDSMGQGAISGTLLADFKKNSVDKDSVVHLNIDKKWSVYASFIDINWAKKLFSKTGLDFIYSPFMVLYSLIKKQKLKTEPTLFMFNHQDSVTIAVFENGNLLFGAYFKTAIDDNLSSLEEEDWESVEEEEGVEEESEFHNIGEDMAEEIGDLDDFSKTESLDFEDTKSNRYPLESFEGEDVIEDSCLELFGRDILIYKYLLSFLREFYKNPLYEGSFIDTVVIYDGFEVSSELISMIEDELFMNIEMSKVDIDEIIYNMARHEALV